MTIGPKTSISHPIRVDWLPTPWLGNVGLTFAPGKTQPVAVSGPWHRDLETDLKRIREYYGVDRLVCLLEDHELIDLSIEDLQEATLANRMSLHRLPIVDGSIPGSETKVRDLVADIAGWAAAGENFVVHCKGGLGRAGTIGGSVLRASGLDAEAVRRALAEARGPSCPETAAQRSFIDNFRPGPPSLSSRVGGAVIGAAVGDALGHPTEFLDYEGRRSQAPIRGPVARGGWSNGWRLRFSHARVSVRAAVLGSIRQGRTLVR